LATEMVLIGEMTFPHNPRGQNEKNDGWIPVRGRIESSEENIIMMIAKEMERMNPSILKLGLLRTLVG